MKKTSISATLLLSALTLSAADVYISPSGLDSNDGTASSPKATLTSALRQAREMRRTNAPGVESGITIHMAPGIYNVYEPVFIRPEDSGTPESPTVITSSGEGAWISGGVSITGWKRQGKLLVDRKSVV